MSLFSVDSFRATPISLEHGDAPRHDSDDDEKGVYLDPYRASPWVYVSPGDEAKVRRPAGGCRTLLLSTQ